MIRVCLVGTGGAAARHVKALRKLGGVRISAVGRDAARAASWVAARGLERAWPSVDEALAGDDDVVVIATPPTSHAELVDRAMAAGKHLLVEKPVFRRHDELRARLAAIRAYPRTFMVAENAHFAPLQELVARTVRDGAIGAPIAVSLRRMRKRAPAEAWKSGAAESDGALGEGGVHWIRCGLQLSGVRGPDDVEWVFAARPRVELLDNDGDDTALLTWRTKAGALGSLWHSWALELGRGVLASSVVGTEGAVHFDLSGRAAAIVRGHRAPRPLVPWGALWARADLTGTTEMWRRFLECVRTGAPAPHTIDEAAADLGVVDAAYRSLASGARETLP